MNDCSDCIYLRVDQDTDGYGREIAPPDIYCAKGHTISTVCCKEYIKWD